MKVLICWSGISGYLTACWRALAARPGIELEVVTFPMLAVTHAQFGVDVTAGLKCTRLETASTGDLALVRNLAVAARPDVIVLAGWSIPAFTALAFRPEFSNCRFVMASDTPRKDTWRQWGARLRKGRLFDRMDRMMVPGERSWQFARRLVPESKVRRGMNGYDGAAFHPVFEHRISGAGGWPRKFLFVGRYVPVKALDVLAEAYTAYRRRVTDPWPLTTCGAGPDGKFLKGVDGVTDRGFVQPADQPAIFADHGVFLLPSRYDAWGVALAEALATGMPAICTEVCGASVELVRSYYNGLVVPTESADALADAMEWMHRNADRLPEFGRRGHTLAAAYSSECWAERWEAVFRELVPNRA